MIHITSKHFLLVLLTLLFLSTTLIPPSKHEIFATPTAGMTELVSLSSDGHQGDSASYNPTISSDGNFVAFESEASNLVSNDTNDTKDIFVHDLQTGQTERVSLSSDGTQGNDISAFPSLSADGRYVAFMSVANNLVTDDTNGAYDVFVHDRESGITQRVSILSNGTQGNNFSHFPSISSDGRYVAFYSFADNLVPNDTNDASDIFIHDRETGLTEILSMSSSGTQGNSSSWYPNISFDGRYVTFDSWATNLISNDTNDATDVFVHDRQTGQTERVSVSNDGTQGNKTSEYASISSDGNYVVFRSWADNLVSDDTNNTTDIFVHNRETGQTERVSVASNGTEGAGYVFYSSISENGRFVAFDSEADKLVGNDTNGTKDVFVHDRQTGQTERVSVSNDGTQGNNESSSPSISASGQYVAFDSYSGNLVDSDTNGTYDVFVHDRCPDGSCQDSSMKSWTLMYYFAADNDLNDQLSVEYTSLHQAARNNNINVVSFFDGIHLESWYTNFNEEDYSGPLMKGELNTGDPKTLSDFISWAKSNFPAKHYALIISGHGHGLGGVAIDETSGKDWLTPTELRQALQTVGKFDVIYMGVCLMANLETEYQLRGLGDYYVASESPSWTPKYHDRYALAIVENTSPEDLSKFIAVDFFNQFPVPRTISVVKLFEVENIQIKASSLASSIRNSSLTDQKKIWDLTDASNLQRFDEDLNLKINNSDNLADLYHFAELVKNVGNPDINNAANELLSALNDYIIFNAKKSGSVEYQKNNTKFTGYWDHSNANGVSIAIPRGWLCFYSFDWLEAAGDAQWPCPQVPRGVDTISIDNSEWGPMLVDLISQFNPDGPEILFPSEPQPPLTIYLQYLPIIEFNH